MKSADSEVDMLQPEDELVEVIRGSLLWLTHRPFRRIGT